MRKFILRKRVISAILTIITSILIAVHPEQALETLKFICKHLAMCTTLEKQTD